MWPTPFQTAQFRPIFTHSASTVRASEKSSISIISTTRKSTMRFPMSHRWTVYVTPKSPKGWHKPRFCYFSVNFNFCRKKSAAKFLCVKTSSDKVVTTSFLYLTVHRCMHHFFVAGNRRHLKFNMWVEHSKSQPTDHKTSMKWAWPRHVTHFKLLVPLRYLWNGLN